MPTAVVSDKAQAFLKEKHIAVLSTFSKDGSVHWNNVAGNGGGFRGALDSGAVF